ncbi:MAG: helix-turn-helix domain-containing protein, partial [Candidatus Limnocylindrales bacterium]
MVNDDVLYGFRLRLFSLAEELGNVRAACRIFGIHPSTYYRWRGPVLRSGLEMLRPRERRPPRMPNQTSQLTEQRVIAFALGHPGLGPRRISATLAQERWGGIVLSPNGVWRVLRRHGLSRRISRLSLVAGYAAPPEPERPTPLEARHVEVDHPGELVGFDCFHVGRLAGTTGRVWQYTAIDLASSHVWAELATTPLEPVRPEDVRPRPAGGGRPRGGRLAPGAGADRQRLRVPQPGVRRHRARAGRDPDLHPGRRSE